MLEKLDLDDFDFITMPSMAYTVAEMVKTITIALAMRRILLNNMLYGCNMLTKLTYLIHFGSVIPYDLRNGNVDKKLST
jgi:hypothetical protein